MYGRILGKAEERMIGPGQLMTIFNRFATSGNLDRKGLRKVVPTQAICRCWCDFLGVFSDIIAGVGSIPGEGGGRRGDAAGAERGDVGSRRGWERGTF